MAIGVLIKRLTRHGEDAKALLKCGAERHLTVHTKGSLWGYPLPTSLLKSR
jgi:hypothetical protein